MKRFYNFIRKAAMVVVAVSLTGMVIVSCKKDSVSPSHAISTLKTDPCPGDTVTLWAGQNIYAGYLHIWNDETNLYVEYNITSSDPNLAMQELHLWAGTNIIDCPENNNSLPKIGKFTYFADATESKPTGTEPFLTDPLNYTFTVPFVDIEYDIANSCSVPIIIAAHAKAVVETLWGQGTRFVPPPGDWAMHFDYYPCCAAK